MYRGQYGTWLRFTKKTYDQTLIIHNALLQALTYLKSLSYHKD